VWWRRTRLGKVRLALFIGVPAALVLGLFTALMIAQGNDDAAGCGSIDPTDPANYSTVVILNDTRTPAVVDDCQGAYCQPDQDRVRLAPGKRVQVNAACGTGGVMTSWRVSGPAGVLGYVAVDTPRKHDGLVYPVSRAATDRAVAAKPLGAP
jgi:hypothetical protein